MAGLPFVLLFVGSVAQIPSSSPLVVQHVNVVDVRAGAVLPDRTVVIAGGVIQSIGPADSASPPPGARVVSGAGKYVMPGLWDMHVHAAWPAVDSLFAPLFVANGVTGVREMFGDIAIIRRWKASYARGDAWPRMTGAGHILDGPRPFWPGSAVSATAEDGRREVDSLIAAGADFIKLYTRLPRDAYFAALAEARRLGKQAVGHVPDAVSVSEASDSGQRSIEHLTGMTVGCSKDADAIRAERAAAAADTSVGRMLLSYARQAEHLLATQDSTACATLMARLARNDTWQVPTLVELRSIAFLDDPKFTADPRVRYMPAEITESWNWRNDFRFRARTPEGWAVAKSVFRRNIEIVSAMHRAGVPILAGTDVLNPFTFPGFSLHDELALLVDAGFSAPEALRAATIAPAIFFGATDSLGAVEPGKRADLVLLDANPLDDIHNTTTIRAVVLNGRFYDRAALDRLIERAERAARRATPRRRARR